MKELEKQGCYIEMENRDKKMEKSVRINRKMLFKMVGGEK